MSMLVDDLFALSRVQGQPENEHRRSVSLAEVVNDVVFEAAETARAADVVLEADVLPNDRLAVLGNHADLTRALTNLLANAIRHTGPGLGVRVRADRTPAGAVRVQVVDQCGGIPEPHLAKVFETGWRGSPARDGDDGGAGLGLAIARGVVRSHDGQIGVRNTGDGCAFELELPSR
jgi:signal transduction histidine kinase